MKSLLFDFGGTLDADGTTWPDRFFSIYKEVGVDLPREAFLRGFYASDDNLAGRHALTGLSFAETLDLQVRDALSVLAPQRPDLAPRIARRFLDDCRRHFRRNKPVLERLAKRYRLGVVSNFYGNLDSVLRSEGLRDLFGAIADSGVVGSIKPAPAIFEHALSGLGSAAAETLMVGDSVPRDMRGAEGLAMPHAWIHANGGEACCAKALKVRSLVELEEKLS